MQISNQFRMLLQIMSIFHPKSCLEWANSLPFSRKNMVRAKGLPKSNVLAYRSSRCIGPSRIHQFNSVSCLGYGFSQ
ncbi:hypothetical protein QN277_026974 [Acacia crassicarpa]|uniref:Uncharacterized protein n=1 Tax=Acacia crassicarpa TaxID=499986 RepID=A0AAE1JBH8_9FABA|nr:hypothetical protein QN277_026974 [Acacia crassicarpa]